MFRNRLSPAEAAQGLASVFNILILKRRRIAEPARLGRERRLPRAWMAQGKSASGKVPASRSSPIAFPLKPAARRLDQAGRCSGEPNSAAGFFPAGNRQPGYFSGAVSRPVYGAGPAMLYPASR